MTSRASSTASDAELLDEWRAGNLASGDALFVRHYDTLARFFRNKVGVEIVADLIQDTLMTLVEGRDRIEDPRRFQVKSHGYGSDGPE